MKRSTRGIVLSGAVAGLLAGAGEPALAREVAFNPVLVGNGTSFCGPCQPGPTVLHAAPNSPVVALRYRWSAEWNGFALVAKDEVGYTDHQGELRFTLEQGEAALDKVVVAVGGALSNAALFLTNGGCSGPRLCPLPFRLHAFASLSAYLAGGPVLATITGAAPGSTLDITQEQYVDDGDRPYWVPVTRPRATAADALGHAVAIFQGAGPGVYRLIARDRETGEESSFALYEVLEGVR
jgi:hypothetical protein